MCFLFCFAVVLKRTGCVGDRSLELVINATEPTMIAAATNIRGVTGSPATSQPSNTATTGFTYAYVAARAGGTFRSNQLYAVKATIEPKTIKYASAPMELQEVPLRFSFPKSPVIEASSRRRKPPANICNPEASEGEVRKGRRIE